ncbi:MAG: flagellar L-ring protein [Proteobacteria bacterium]|nr:flagellar L-ring protein [Pseudomonadota bacterium]
MLRTFNCLLLVMLAAYMTAAASKKDKEAAGLTPLDRYIQESAARQQSPAELAPPGSLWSPASRLTVLTRDVRASQLDDIVTILVSESASAVSRGTTKSGRQSSVKAGVDAFGGITKAVGPLANLAGANSQSQMNGEAETTRESLVTTTVATRVTNVLPNGNLVLQGTKEIQVNSEKQVVTVRGIVRPSDLSPQNTVPSDRLAMLEVHINGKGVVGDAIRRPFILYRLLLGILPF